MKPTKKTYYKRINFEKIYKFKIFLKTIIMNFSMNARWISDLWNSGWDSALRRLDFSVYNTLFIRHYRPSQTTACSHVRTAMENLIDHDIEVQQKYICSTANSKHARRPHLKQKRARVWSACNASWFHYGQNSKFTLHSTRVSVLGKALQQSCSVILPH